MRVLLSAVGQVQLSVGTVAYYQGHLALLIQGRQKSQPGDKPAQGPHPLVGREH